MLNVMDANIQELAEFFGVAPTQVAIRDEEDKPCQHGDWGTDDGYCNGCGKYVSR